MITQLQPGSAFPIGATASPGGVNFSVYADKAEAIELLLFDGVDDARPAQVFRLDPRQHRTYHYWHAFVPGVQPGQIYAYRAIGPYAPAQGLRYDADKVLLGPYGRCVAMPAAYSREAASRPGDNAAAAMKSVVVDSASYDWEPLEFVLPAAPASSPGWRLWIDTTRPSPGDIYARASMSLVNADRYWVGPRSIVALAASLEQSPDP